VITLRGTMLLSLLLLLACSPGGEADSPIFHTYVGEEPGTLDPAFAVDKTSGVIVSLIYPGLFRFSATGEPEPDLVTDWSLSDDGTSYTFSLDPRRNFDGGQPVDARAIEACWLRLLDSDHPSPRRWVLARLVGAEPYMQGESNGVAGIQVVNDSTLVLKLTEPFSPFPGLLAMPSTRIYPLTAGRPAEKNDLPVCGGPWRLDKWNKGDRLLLGRRSEAPENHFTGLEFRIIPQPFTAVAEFEVGNLDLLGIPLAEINYWQDGPSQEQIRRQEELIISYIGFNVTRPPFDNLLVRRALNYAIDVESLIRTMRSGAAVRALGPVPPALRGENPGEIFRYRPARARELLAEAGYPDGFSFEIWQKENPEVSRLLEAVQIYLGDVGLKMKIVARDWGAFKDAVNKGSADAFFLDWLADYPDAENFLVPLFHSANHGGGGNRSHYMNSYVDILLDELQRTSEGEHRRRLVNELNETIYHQAPWIWLWHPVSMQVVGERIVNYRSPVIFNGQDYLEVSYDAALSGR
jgi:ABC-type transport system substrate-binding protein